MRSKLAISTSLLLLVVVVAAASCASAPRGQSASEPPSAIPQPSTSDPGLRPNDVLTIQVFGEKELSGKFQVSERGTIDYPLVGRMKVVGLTPPAVADLLTTRLKAGFLKEPNVSVYVEDYGAKKKIHVWGQVYKSGTFSFAYQMSIIEAITLAGGTTPMADNEFKVTRIEDGKSQTINVRADESAQYMLKPGDVVYVPERVF